MGMLDPPGDEIVRGNRQRFLVTGGQSPDDVNAWYRSADIFSLPSGDESMLIAPIEAAHHGLPVVLTDLDCYEGDLAPRRERADPSDRRLRNAGLESEDADRKPADSENHHHRRPVRGAAIQRKTDWRDLRRGADRGDQRVRIAPLA